MYIEQHCHHLYLLLSRNSHLQKETGLTGKSTGTRAAPSPFSSEALLSVDTANNCG